MVLVLFFALLFLLGCTQAERDNPLDPDGVNYTSGSSSSAFVGTIGTFIDLRDSKIYNWVRIGDQIWMVENLNYNAIGSVCYNNNSSNCTTYGRLYNWATAMSLGSSCNTNTCASLVQPKHRGVCPEGWHIPSDAEWDELTAAVGGTGEGGRTGAATPLKAVDGWYASSDVLGTNASGFSALPGGIGYADGDFEYAYYEGYWWSSSEGNGNSAYYRYMYCLDENANWFESFKSLLLSVRCLQD